MQPSLSASSPLSRSSCRVYAVLDARSGRGCDAAWLPSLLHTLLCCRLWSRRCASSLSAVALTGETGSPHWLLRAEAGPHELRQLQQQLEAVGQPPACAASAAVPAVCQWQPLLAALQLVYSAERLQQASGRLRETQPPLSLPAAHLLLLSSSTRLLRCSPDADAAARSVMLRLRSDCRLTVTAVRLVSPQLQCEAVQAAGEEEKDDGWLRSLDCETALCAASGPAVCSLLLRALTDAEPSSAAAARTAAAHLSSLSIAGSRQRCWSGQLSLRPAAMICLQPSSLQLCLCHDAPVLDDGRSALPLSSGCPLREAAEGGGLQLSGVCRLELDGDFSWQRDCYGRPVSAAGFAALMPLLRRLAAEGETLVLQAAAPLRFFALQQETSGTDGSGGVWLLPMSCAEQRLRPDCRPTARLGLSAASQQRLRRRVAAALDGRLRPVTAYQPGRGCDGWAAAVSAVLQSTQQLLRSSFRSPRPAAVSLQSDLPQQTSRQQQPQHRARSRSADERPERRQPRASAPSAARSNRRGGSSGPQRQRSAGAEEGRRAAVAAAVRGKRKAAAAAGRSGGGGGWQADGCSREVLADAAAVLHEEWSDAATVRELVQRSAARSKVTGDGAPRRSLRLQEEETRQAARDETAARMMAAIDLKLAEARRKRLRTAAAAEQTIH